VTQQSLADRYHHDVHAAARAHLSAEPEAQLTTPISNLFRAIVAESGLGEITLVREQRTGRTRPDFGVLHRKVGSVRQFQKGYIELKAPSVSVDTSTWKGKDRNAHQWRQMAVEAEVLIVCNGKQARLYVDGEPDGLDADLPYENTRGWDRRPLENLLRRFLDARVSPVKSIGELATRLAHRTADLRDRLLWLLEQPSEAGEMARLQHEAWRRAIHAESSARDFADGISQVVSYGMVLAALSGQDADSNNDGIITVQEARSAVSGISPVMAAAFGPLLEEPLWSAVQVEVGHLEALISAIDVGRVTASSDRRGEPWLYFYEDFLGVYDPVERKQAGVYYTPTAVVRAMVAMVDHVLVERFGLRAGFADPSVVTLDPAVGTGTFPIAVLDRAAERMEALRGPAGRAQVAANLAQNLHGFELLPGAYAVAHLRLTQRLRQLDPVARPYAKIILTDTLESPEGVETQLALFGDARILASEQNRAKRLKAQQKVTVVIGNPPYRRLAKDVKGRGAGGWIFEPFKRGRKRTASLFDDMLDVARQHTIFSHHASLYNLYVYFWRWALWKAFEAHGDGPAVVAFITGSSWLTGPGFMGLRQIVRQSCDEAWVIDLGGDNKGTNPEENVFAIETPVAVVVLVRTADHDPKKTARIHYRRVSGRREDKLAAMEAVAASSDPFGGEWDSASDGLRDRMVPDTGGEAWEGFPALADLFPWQQPGCKFGRTWPIAPSEDQLTARWRRFMAGAPDERPELFSTSKYGRTVHTDVLGFRRLVEEASDAKHQPIRRYGYRSFDRQWTFEDPRLASLERPSLWQSVSSRQVFLAAPASFTVSNGPACTASTGVPDLHYFRGSFGGKDIVPLYRDADGNEPNVTRGLLTAIGKAHGTKPPTPEDLAAYVYALLSAPAYQARFEVALQTPGLRVPLTADADLWREAVELGAWLLWLHTYAERFQGPGRGRFVPTVPGLGWTSPVRTMPETAKQIDYNAATQELHVGDGVVGGVRPEVWEFSVSGMPVVKKWLGYRTAKGAGKAASSKNELDRIRPSAWPDEWNDELLDLLRVLTLSCDRHGEQEDLLDRICAGPLLAPSDLPKPKAAERKPPVKE